MATTPTRNPRTARRKPPTVDFQAPEAKKPAASRRSSAAPTPEPEQQEVVAATTGNPRPTEHNGIAVVSQERIPGPNGGFFKITRLELADGGKAFGCWECTHTAETRGDIMAHRNAEHGTMYGKMRGKTGRPRQNDPDLFDLILPDRSDGSRPGDRPVDWTLGEVIAVVPSIKALGDRLEKLEEENEAMRVALKQTRVSKADQHKIDVYESHQIEIGELRAKVARQGNYEEVKDELYALRAWKKRVTTKLDSVGFKLQEED